MSSDEVEVTLTISREAYERAKELVQERDPRASAIGEFAGMMDVEEFLTFFLDMQLKEFAPSRSS